MTRSSVRFSTQRLLAMLALGIAVLAVVGIAMDFKKVGHALKGFSWFIVLPILALSTLNYIIRFIKWRYYLRVIGIDIPDSSNALVFFSGLSMSISPGKFGEALKSLLLKQRWGIAVSRSIGVVFAERLTDLIALVILCAAGSLSFAYGRMILVLLVVFLIILTGSIVSPRISIFFTRIVSRIRFLAGFAEKINASLEGARQLLTIRLLAIGSVLSVAGWSLECIGFKLVLESFTKPSGLTLAQSIFVYSGGTLFGALTMLPGGLGATEGGISGMLFELFSVTKGMAGAATIIIRLCTLWFGVLAGAAALSLWGRKGNPKMEEF